MSNIENKLSKITQYIFSIYIFEENNYTLTLLIYIHKELNRPVCVTSTSERLINRTRVRNRCSQFLMFPPSPLFAQLDAV